MSDSVVEPPSPKRTKVDADSCDAPIVAAVSTAASDHVAPAANTTADTSVEPSEVSEHPVSNGAAPDAPAAIDDTTGEPLSKRARKKIAKLAAYQQNKLAKRHAERAKHRQRRAEAVARGDPPTGPSRKALKNNTRAASTNRHRICVDMDFDGLMIDKDVCKCAKQLLWVYTINRKAPAPAQLFYSGVRPGSRVQLALERNDGYRNWDIDIGEQSYMERFEAASIVYLTSDSDTVLTELSADDVYVIGGLVDHNHHKGLTLARAQERGLRTARLPLGEHVRLKTRTVLTIVHGEFLAPKHTIK